MIRETVDSSSRRVAANGVRLNVYRWEPAQGSTVADTGRPWPRAILVVIHGILEHAGRYGELAHCLSRAGIAVWAVDLRGHGRSSGWRAWVNRFDQYVDDVLAVVAEARAAHPGTPVFLLGHSMGGLIALQPRLAEVSGAAGIVLSAPALQVADQFAPTLRKLAAFGSRWFPWMRLARLGCALMSRDARVVADYRHDPLVYHGRIPTRTGAEIIRAGEETRQHAGEIRSSLLILQGTADAVITSQAVEAFFRSAGSGDKTLRLYPGLYHDLPREPEKAEIFSEIAHWILARC
ncbi:MAG: alpha/beta hydrolase [Thermoguttaceae bacterium]